MLFRFLELYRIFPAHGGSDPGMTAPDGTEEKEINLEISLKLKKVLEAEGYQVVMTRDTDEGLYDEDASNRKIQDMKRRIDIIEKTRPIVTVSIHQNSYPEDSSVAGPQVFYYQNSEQGRALAEIIQQSMNTALAPERPRKAKGNSSYYLLKKSSGPLVIVECGFLTSSRERKLLKTEEYQTKTAEAVARGIILFIVKNV